MINWIKCKILNDRYEGFLSWQDPESDTPYYTIHGTTLECGAYLDSKSIDSIRFASVEDAKKAAELIHAGRLAP